MMNYKYVFLFVFMIPLLGVGQKRLPLNPHIFDFGPNESIKKKNVYQITPETLFSPDSGYGWTKKPNDDFVHHKFIKSRDSITIDGVIGDEIAFKMNVLESDWQVTVFMDAGYEDSSTVSLQMNDEDIPLNWHPFHPSAEPGKVFQTNYRVFQGYISKAQSIELSIKGGNDEVRLLGCYLFPVPEVKTVKHQRLYQQIQELGKYPGEGDLSEIWNELKSNRNPDEIFFSYWSHQIELLQRAEQHFERRGWEKYIEITGLSIWGQLHQAVMILDGLINHSNPESNPLYERALYMRGRILYWLGLERGGPNEISRGKADLEWLLSKYPDDELLAMYNGQKIDIPDPCDNLIFNPEAPEWSVKQRELLCRMKNIAHWWVLEQQSENGEFGGKLGDDVELLRWWTPLLLVGDTLAFSGWSKLADEIFRNKKVYKGYSKKPIDVEHASEFIADTGPILVVSSDLPIYMDRLYYSVDYFINLWTGISDNGHRFFRSSWYGSTEVNTDPPRNRDHGYNARATKAVRYYAWKSGDDAVNKALNEWSEAWLSFAKSTDKGKPLGILPASVRFPDEAFNGDEPNWYQANMYWPYFEWSANAGCMILDQLLYSYSATRDEKFLEPLLITLNLMEKYENFEGEAAKGSEAWAIKILQNKSSFWSVAAQWRFLTNDKRYDPLLLKYGTPYLKYRLTKDEVYLESGLDIVLENARYNTPLKTYEAIHTDRVYIRGYEHLTTMLTGNGSSEGLSPFYAVTWENTSDGFTALLNSSSFNNVVFQVYSHANNSTNPTIRLWQLDPGAYELSVNGKVKEVIPIESKGHRLSLTIPPHELTTVEIRQR